LPTLTTEDELRTMLTQLSVEAGELDQAIKWGEVSFDVDVPPAMRKRVARDLHALKADTLRVRRCPPFGALAERVNEAVGFPVVDGLGLAGLAFVLGTRPDFLPQPASLVTAGCGARRPWSLSLSGLAA
jgi:hypothetical protein